MDDEAKLNLSAREQVMCVRVSSDVEKKAVQLHKIRKYSFANHAWGKDQKLLKYNLLLAPNSKNYTVLLALGRKVNRLPRAV